VLEWLLISELIVLACAALFYGIGMVLVKSDPRDPIYIFTSTFWRNVLWPPLVMETDSMKMSRKRYEPAADESAAPAGGGDDDALYGRVKRDRDGRIVTSNLELLVIPNSAQNKVVGVEDGGLKIEVTGEAGDGRTNKSLVEIVSKAIDVKPYQCTITKGHYHSRKTMQVQGLRPDELDDRLANLPQE
jgi:uncharacterized protein YggU (UPF0235/DUF167 family)